ncbi:putative Membrane-associated tyrosine- and threonine-specific cdc2-inhibitory kinase [Blattamonas nauphoetae]|uniref:non-specific serine/threonine protein kinase n=1 Tax=Blattamonas nauphoetae TaxID=2049346 RepID=A0ABQ9XDT0_9EUKA|nr:putative Membrane-associated tyrosine- and threonine-specific cdc2-inhibitory kinase [Blattamonas nauphoetae]
MTSNQSESGTIVVEAEDISLKMKKLSLAKNDELLNMGSTVETVETAIFSPVPDTNESSLTSLFDSSTSAPQSTTHVSPDPTPPKPVPKPKSSTKFIPKMIGPYIYHSTIGQGSFGAVYRVVCTKDQETYAMKMLSCMTDEDHERNEREIANFRKFQHPNVVTFIDSQFDGNTHTLVMELCQHSLHTVMKNCEATGTSLPLHVIYAMMEGILSAITFLHEHDKFYGDLKPDNVLIAQDGTAKLGDFGGVTGAGTQKTGSSSEQGTIQYWPPEMFLSSGGVQTMKGDVWAFGLMLLQLMTGKSWIEGTNALEIAKSIENFSIDEATQGMESDVATLFRLLLDKTPENRISSAELSKSTRLMAILGPPTPLSQYYAAKLAKQEEIISQLKANQKPNKNEPVSTSKKSSFKEDPKSMNASQRDVRGEDLPQSRRSIPEAPSSVNTTEDINSTSGSAQPSNQLVIGKQKYPLKMPIPRHFDITGQKVARTSHDFPHKPGPHYSTCLVNRTFADCIVSIQVSSPRLAHIGDAGNIYLGFIRSDQNLPNADSRLGDLPHSAALSFFSGHLFVNHSNSGPFIRHGHAICDKIPHRAIIRMELDLRPAKPTARFFVNNTEANKYLLNIPRTVKLAWTLYIETTSMVVDQIDIMKDPTPISPNIPSMSF